MAVRLSNCSEKASDSLRNKLSTPSTLKVIFALSSYLSSYNEKAIKALCRPPIYHNKMEELSAFPNDTTSKLAALFFTRSL